MQCKGLSEAGCGPVGETGMAEVDAAEDMDVRLGVDVEVDDKDDIGREEYDMGREAGGEVGYSAGRSSTSIESM